MSDLHVVVLAAGKGTRMKSARAEGAAPRRRPADDRARARGRRRARAAIDDRRRRASGRSAHGGAGGASGPHVRGAGATTRHGARPADRPSRRSRGAAGTLVLLSGDVPLLSADTLENAGRAPRSRRRRRHGRHRDRRQPARLRPDRPRPASRLHVLSRRRTPARPSGRSARSTRASTPSRSTACSTRVRSIAAENAQREYYLPDLVAIYRQRGPAVETVTVANADEIRASTAASSWRQ